MYGLTSNQYLPTSRGLKGSEAFFRGSAIWIFTYTWCTWVFFTSAASASEYPLNSERLPRRRLAKQAIQYTITPTRSSCDHEQQ